MTDPTPLRTVSYGGGVQSTALLVLAAQGYIDYQTFLFSNVGDDSEYPATLRYVREVAFEYAADHGIEIHELQRIPKRGKMKGQPETLWGRLMTDGSRSLPIPVRMPDTGAPGLRSCTADFKIRVVQEWIKAHGATDANPATVAIGISTDEYQRATSRKREPWENLDYPLLHLEHRRARPGGGLDRSACAQIIADAGLPVPPKSSCFFCPFHKATVWADMARDEPELFAKSAHLEDTLNVRRSGLPCPGAGKYPAEAAHADPDDEDAASVWRGAWAPEADQAATCPSCRSRQTVEPDGDEWRMAAHQRGPVYLTRFGKPLRSIFGAESGAGIQGSLLAPGWDEDEGYRCGDVCDT